MRQILFALFLLGNSTVAQAQTTPNNGELFYIRSVIGGRLSAQQGENLAVVTNADTWEQWQWSNSRFLSYHGTIMLRETGGPRRGLAAHAPPDTTANEIVPEFRPVNANGSVGSGPPIVGQPFVILFPVIPGQTYTKLAKSGAGQTMFSGSISAASGALNPATNTSGEPERWILDRVAANDVRQGRHAERTALRGNSPAPTTVYITPPGSSAQLIPGNYRDYSFLALGSLPASGTFKWFNGINDGTVARYGQASVFWDTRVATKNLFDMTDMGLKEPTTGLTKAVVNGPVGMGASNKIIVPCEDPFQIGDRIPANASVCIYSQGNSKYLSRGPSGWIVWSGLMGATETWEVKQ